MLLLSASGSTNLRGHQVQTFDPRPARTGQLKHGAASTSGKASRSNMEMLDTHLGQAPVEVSQASFPLAASRLGDFLAFMRAGWARYCLPALGLGM